MEVALGHTAVLFRVGERVRLQMLGMIFRGICLEDPYLGGGFKYFLFSSLLGEDSHFD